MRRFRKLINRTQPIRLGLSVLATRFIASLMALLLAAAGATGCKRAAPVEDTSLKGSSLQAPADTPLEGSALQTLEVTCPMCLGH